MKKQKRYKAIVGIVLAVAIVIVSVYSCTKNMTGHSVPLEESKTPTVSYTVIDKTIDETIDETTEISHEIATGEVDDAYSIVCSAVEHRLENAGFMTKAGVANSIVHDDYSALGICYYTNDFSLFDDNMYVTSGFVEITNKTEVSAYSMEKDDVIMVVPCEDTDEETQYICTYNFNDIGSSHLVYNNQYIQYYQQSDMKVVYSVHENDVDNYDLSLGSLYDYDNKEYIYDESIFGEYVTHSAVNLFSDQDCEELDRYLQQLSEEQLKAGYYVTEFSVVYISPESIKAYLDSEEKETFYGYNVEELTEAFGAGTALRYTDDGFEQAQIINTNIEPYDWKTFLTKITIGCGIILIGATLTAVTGGASFGCALLSITQIATGTAVTEALGRVVLETVHGMIDGKSLLESLDGAKYTALDAFAEGFLIGAAIGSVGVATGIIKPSACFVAGTMVSVLRENEKFNIPIEQVVLGDKILSYSENDERNSYESVTDILKNTTSETLCITFDSGDIIETTKTHPFYVYDGMSWCDAQNLKKGDRIFDSQKGYKIIVDITLKQYPKRINVYNLTVNRNHNYYVGHCGVLVHNTCVEYQRQKAVKEAWKKEVEAVKNGTSKYNWTSKQVKELLSKGKVHGYEGVHIKDVSKLIGTKAEALIGNPDNIVFLTRKQHFAAHLGKWSNETSTDVIVEFLPWAQERISAILAAAA